MPNEPTVGAYTTLAAGVLSISWSAIFVRWTEMPGVASAFYRVLFASIALWLLVPVSKASLTRIDRSTFWLAALGGVFFAGDLGLYNVAVLRTSAGTATVLSNSSPLFVGLLTWTSTRRSPSRRFWMALAIALSGTCSIVAVDARHLGSRSSADLLAVTSSLCFALYLMVTERIRRSCGTGTLLALSTTASTAALLVFASATRVSLRVPGLSSLAALVGLGIVCQLAGYFSLTYALGHLPATVTSVTLLAIAPLTSALAFAIFGERMTAAQMLGGSLVLIGVWAVTGRHHSEDGGPGE